MPTYPDWVWRMKPVDPRGDELFGMLVKESVVVPSPATDALGQIAKDNGIFMVMGVNEREAERSGTLYNTMLYFGPDGTLLGKHRKLLPSSPERMVWGFGDGSTLLQVHDTPFGRVGGLLCWENYMPLRAGRDLRRGRRHLLRAHLGPWRELDRHSPPHSAGGPLLRDRRLDRQSHE